MKLEARILYMDEDLIAVYKPAGLLSHPSADPTRPDLVSWLRTQITAEKLVMHHRLDLETSGLLVLTRSLRACPPLAQAFEQRRIQKTYLAMVKGNPPARGQIDQPLAESGGRVRADRVGKPAVTDFKRLRSKSGYALLELSPRHGRKHQLRVHCLSRGWPIVGDKLYGGEPSQRMWLHAWRLRLEHPVSGEIMNLECPSPEQWGLFGRIAAAE
ncbi:RluA family pseudouridine synthase [bacterium]|nr:RluA family pseudouridine synthase [bacterium]